MSPIFSAGKKVLGLDITHEAIRFALAKERGGDKRLIGYGEERLVGKETKQAILSALLAIRKKTGVHQAVASLPKDVARFETVSARAGAATKDIRFALAEEGLISSDEAILYVEEVARVNKEASYRALILSSHDAEFFKTIFAHAGISSVRFVCPEDALIKSCVKNGSLVSAMCAHLESSLALIAFYYPFDHMEGLMTRLERDDIPRFLTDAHIRFYQLRGEPVGQLLVSGALSTTPNFQNYIAKATRLPISEADALVNFHREDDEVPIITKSESLAYAVALGLSLTDI